METDAAPTTGLHIFVNRRRFEEGDGVHPEMTGREIATLVATPPENAVVHTVRQNREVGLDETIHIFPGEHFLVTRRVVEGGCHARANRA